VSVAWRQSAGAAEAAGIDALRACRPVLPGPCRQLAPAKLFPQMQARDFSTARAYARQLLKDLKSVKAFSHAHGSSCPGRGCLRALRGLWSSAGTRWTILLDRPGSMKEELTMADEETIRDIRSSTRTSISGTLDRNYYPWLCDPTPVPFRYGDIPRSN